VGSVLIMLATQFKCPPELGADVYVIDDALPVAKERKVLIRQVGEASVAVGAAPLTPEGERTAVRLTRGLSQFAVEQTLALSMTQGGLDEAALKARFVQAVNATPGLRYEPDPVTLESIGGLANFKDFCRKTAAGRKPPDVVVRIDEIEKAMAGSGGAGSGGGDSSGTSQDFLNMLLQWMQEEDVTGIIAVGPPGVGKSLCSMAMGAALSVPTITLDLGGMKTSLLGESERNIRTALKMIKSLASRSFPSRLHPHPSRSPLRP
jgi:hypothetical protein